MSAVADVPGTEPLDGEQPAVDELRQAVVEAVDVLRGLPRHGGEVDRARELVERWAAGRRCRPVLVVDSPPGQTDVDYDLLLDHPDGGTVAVNVQLADGVPWSVDHATHWAAGHVLTIDGQHSVSVPEALMALRSAGLRDPRVHEQLVDHRLLLTEADADREPVTRRERQLAADQFRRHQRLHSREATLAWLEELDLPLPAFERHIESLARIRRFREAKQAELAPGHLAAHRDDFAVLHAVWAGCADPWVAGQLAGVEPGDLLAAATHQLGQGAQVDLRATRGVRADVPPVLRDAPPGMVVGPVLDDSRHLVGAVISRTPAEDGPELTAAAGRAAFDAWLRARRASADVRWHWV